MSKVQITILEVVVESMEEKIMLDDAGVVVEKMAVTVVLVVMEVELAVLEFYLLMNTQHLHKFFLSVYNSSYLKEKYNISLSLSLSLSLFL